MRIRLRLLSAAIALACCPLALFATHNRAGEIHVEQIGPLTVRTTIITWTKASSVNADRDTLTIHWGDGSMEQVVRTNGPGTPPQGDVKPNDIKYNTYIAIHTYAGPATYRISMTDPNRIAGIVNVNPPSSDNVPFHIETIYSFQDPQFGGENTTPYLLQPPIDNACVGKPFKHNPNAFDPDDDSLSYHLIVPLQSLGTPVPNYSFPNQISPVNNFLSLDPVSGDILWQTPQSPGEYNLAFIIVSWRNGVAIDTTIRDMQIFVDVCDNNPPMVSTIKDTCIVAGQTLEFEVVATDPDSTDLVQLTALGGPLSSPYSPATFDAPPGFNPPPVSGTFRWQTSCEHISNQPYSVVFKGLDSVSKTIPQLADLKTLKIKVVGPPPEDVQATAQLGVVEISWEKPYFCEDAAENYFFGFSVWRREGSNPFERDTCMPGLAGKGYTELIFITKQELNGRYYFKDTQVERGRTYCYRILAKFARISAGGYPYNLVESLASDEVCVQLPRDLPLITNVSVESTDLLAGNMKVCWSKPVASDLDTVINHGPYRYQVLRAPGLTGGTMQEIPGASFTANEFWQANDTCFTDTGLNTEGQPYHYRVDFYVKGLDTPLGATNDASSVFLSVGSTDQTNLLSWQEAVPWGNYRYDIFRKNDATGLFDSIGFSTTNSYADIGLINGKEYCYYVRSAGTYSIGGIADPLFNNSQENCGIPIDTIPPCAPVLTVGNLCTGQDGPEPDPPYENNLSWTNPNEQCGGSDDATTYRIWFAPTDSEPLGLLEIIDGAENTSFTHELSDGLAGCYAVTAVDSVGNESARSNLVCVDNCPNYRLPNAFTPNGDDQNDLFVPFPGWRFIDRVDMQIFNRWGNLVFATQDPAIEWNGRNAEDKELPEGTYFFVCKVYENRVGGTVLRENILSGYIELIRGGR
ncbi:MAG: gliding motility-associated C-terminal domain-containing protein [Lewinellaceae bacterium]|nr:gliding motility-associated C-terminal domain-containing protein [Lewinellaceae bacterium]